MIETDFEIVKNNVAVGRVANTYLFVGQNKANMLGYADKLITLILQSNFTDLTTEDKELAIEKLKNFSNPDIHYFFPINTTKSSNNDECINFMQQWVEINTSKPGFDLADWYEKIELGNKQGVIGKKQAENINKINSMKSYQGGLKVVIIWMAEKMNVHAANKILKTIEEPSKKTIFILICENENEILATIRSRCQKVYFRHQSVDNQEVNEENEGLFVSWARSAFRAKNDKSAILDLIDFAEKMSSKTREEHKAFMRFCLSVFRDCLLYNYRVIDNSEKYKCGLVLSKFAPFVHESNIELFCDEIEKGYLEIERNGNSKIIFLDTSINLSRILHMKPSFNEN